tara:strand:+ start:133 stop:402 length:270 start_codon:yes stop_codon:yes gene_type:complete
MKMTDSFLHNHQSALDSFMEDKAIQDLEDAGIYPVPDNTEILETLFEESYEEIKNNNLLGFDEEEIIFAAQCEAQRRFEELPEPGDYDD